MVGARMAVDLGVFRALSESPKPLTVKDLARQSGASPQLTGTTRPSFSEQLSVLTSCRPPFEVPSLNQHD